MQNASDTRRSKLDAISFGPAAWSFKSRRGDLPIDLTQRFARPAAPMGFWAIDRSGPRQTRFWISISMPVDRKRLALVPRIPARVSRSRFSAATPGSTDSNRPSVRPVACSGPFAKRAHLTHLDFRWQPQPQRRIGLSIRIAEVVETRNEVDLLPQTSGDQSTFRLRRDCRESVLFTDAIARVSSNRQDRRRWGRRLKRRRSNPLGPINGALLPGERRQFEIATIGRRFRR